MLETALPTLEGWYQVVCYPLLDAKGTQWGAVSAVRDITERRRVQEALREIDTEQRRTQAALKQAEEKYRGIFENAIEGIFQSSPDGRFISANPAMARMFGYDSAEELINDRRDIELQHYVEPERRRFFEKLISEEGMVQGFELQAYRKDGSTIWISENVRAVRDDNGTLLYYEGIVEDITQRKQVEAERIELLRRLVKAQEDEQRRISRELHDQLGQSLAALLLGLKTLKNSVQEESTIVSIQRLQEITNRIAGEMHSLIRELRPTALDDLGLQTALANYLEEWAERSNVTIDFHSNGLLEQRLDSQIESTIYRIVQEALNNVMKHANAKNVSIIMEKRGNRVLVIIEDDGAGFDAERLLKTPATNRGFGLLGMQERAALVGGSLSIESTPGIGTTVLVHIDLGQQFGGRSE
jgi:PAS domain S-box-containing protein